jgi:hypothetical protein
MTDRRELIDQASLEEYLRLRFPKRSHAKEELLGDLVRDLRSAKYVTTDQLDQLRVRGEEAAVQLDATYHPEEPFDDAAFLEAVLDLVEPSVFERKRRQGRGYEDYFDALERVRHYVNLS